jgi:hypothetical protein
VLAFRFCNVGKISLRYKWPAVVIVSVLKAVILTILQ